MNSPNALTCQLNFFSLIPLKIPHLLRCFNFLAHATYAKYASFLENLAPCTCLPQAGLEHFERNPFL